MINTKTNNTINLKPAAGRLSLCLIFLLLISVTVWAETYYCDPINGDTENNDGLTLETAWGTLQSVLENKYDSNLSDGDTLLCYTGNHGAIDIDGKQNSDWITCKAAINNDPCVSVIEGDDYSQDESYWKFIGFEVSEIYGSATNVLVDVRSDSGLTNNIWIEDCNIYSSKYSTYKDFNDAEWADLKTDGVFLLCDYPTLKNSHIHGVEVGVMTDSNSLCQNNLVEFFTEDAFKIRGNNSTWQGNTIRDVVYVTGKHNDAWQTDNETRIYRNCNWYRNKVINYYNIDKIQGSQSTLQGLFGKLLDTDEYYFEDCNVVNNLFAVDSGWGIRLEDANNTKIVNNICVRPYGKTNQPGISLQENPSDTVIYNNITHGWTTGDGVTDSNNIDFDNYVSDPNQLFTDYGSNNFNTATGSPAIDAGTSTDAPSDDILGNPRDSIPDAGAYEYISSDNHSPVLGSIRDKSVTEGTQLSFTVSASDSDGDSLTYSASGLPAGADFTNQTFSWTPGSDQIGSYDVTFSVSDGNASDSETITITVNEVNHDPDISAIPDTITKTEGDTLTRAEVELATDPDGDTLTYTYTGWVLSLPYDISYNDSGTHNLHVEVSDGTATAAKDVTVEVDNLNRAPTFSDIPDQTISENETLSLTVSASDPDGDTVTITAGALPAGADFTANTLTWTPDYTQAGTYDITFTADDGQAQTMETVTITVNNVNRDVSLDPIGSKTVAEDSTLSFTVSASDPDEDDISYSTSPLPEGASFTNPGFSWTPGYEQEGTYEVTFYASDGQSQDSETVSITVNNTNRDPTLSDLTNKSINENQTLTFTISASDPDGDNLTYSAQNLPTGASLTGQNYEWTPTYDQAGTYNITFTASDGTAEDSQTITVTVENSNRPPEIDPLPAQNINEKETLSLTVSATDPEDDSVTITAGTLPAGADFTANTLTWTPDYDQEGSYDITFTATDGESEDTETLSVTVGNTNRSPVLNTISDKSVTENQTLSFTISAEDADNDTLAYSTGSLPEGADFTGQTFTWTPGYEQAGTYSVTFTADDGQAQDSQTINITVANNNRLPVISNASDKSVDENTELTFSLTAGDPDGDTVTLSATGLPTGASFTGGTFNWTPDYTQAGTYNVTFTADDSTDQTTEQINITVQNVNRSPVLQSIAAKEGSEDQLLTFTVSADDPDGDTITYSATNLPEGATFTGQTFEWTPTYEQAGTYTVTFTASDTESQDSQSVTININNVNRKPIIDSISNKTGDEDSLLTFEVSATDPDGDSLSFSAQDLPQGATFSNQIFRWTPTYEQAGTYNATFTVSDGTDQDSQTVTLTVNNVNRSPVIGSIDNKTVTENNLLSFEVSATDPDGDELTISASSLPTGATFGADTFSWTPTYEQSGNYNVTFTADDGTAQDSQTIAITVGNNNRPPEIASLSAQSINEKETLDMTISATDPDGDDVTITAAGLPNGADFTANTLSWTPNYDQKGTYEITFTATDSRQQDTETLTITVDNTNRAPLMADISDKSIAENQTLSFDISAEDPDGDSLSYSATSLPNGAIFSNQSFIWTPDFSQSGVHNVTFSVSDGSLTDSRTVAVNVGNHNRSPVLESIPDKTVKENETLSFTVSASDPDGDDIEYSARNLPDGAVFTGGNFEWTPGTVNSDVEYTLTFTASDGELEDTETAGITVYNRDLTPPEVTSLSPSNNSIQKSINTLVSLHIVDTDSGVDANTVSIKVNDNTVYTGDTPSYNSPYGNCRRRGSKTDYRYIYQPDTDFPYDEEITVKVNASDLADNSNAMAEYTCSFKTEMRSFGKNKKASFGASGLDKNNPAAVTDSFGNIWAVWQAGENGSRDIYLGKLPSDSEQFESSVQLTDSAGDQCNPDISVKSNNKLYVVWQDNREGNWDIYGKVSSNGAEWSTEKKISDSNDNETHPKIAANSSGSGNSNVYVSWEDDRSGDKDIYLASSGNDFLTSTVTRITSDNSEQSEPDMTVTGDGTVYLVWTDKRNGTSDIYGAASSNLWTNAAVISNVNTQKSPVISAEDTGNVLHLVWVDDTGGDNDIYYVSANGLPSSPLTGTSIIDDSTNAEQLEPALVTTGSTGNNLKVFVCWKDERNDDTDLYFAEVSNNPETNVFIGDNQTASSQSKPAIGCDINGYPCIIWEDKRDNFDEIYYSGSNYVDPGLMANKNVSSNSKAIVGTEAAAIKTADDVSMNVPAGAINYDVRISVSKLKNPKHLSVNRFSLPYEFGPSGIEFDKPVTITIPYRVPASESSPSAYWYDPVTDSLSQNGISNVRIIKISSSLHALQFEADHFTQFLIGSSVAAAAGGGGGGGGCSMSQGGEGTIVEFLIPYMLILGVWGLVKRRTRRTEENSN